MGNVVKLPANTDAYQSPDVIDDRRDDIHASSSDVAPMPVSVATAQAVRERSARVATAQQTASDGGEQAAAKIAVGAVVTASMAASAFHGYRRNHSMGWAIWWGFMGTLFPVITPTIALAQGYAERPGRR